MKDDRSLDEIHAQHARFDVIDVPYTNWKRTQSQSEIYLTISSIVQNLIADEEDRQYPDPVLLKLAQDLGVDAENLKEYFEFGIEANADFYYANGMIEQWDANPAMEYAKLASGME